MSRLNRTAFLLIVLVVAIMTLLYGGVHQPVISLFYISAAVLACVWAADRWANGGPALSMNPLQVPLIGLGIYAIIQIIPFGTSVDPALPSGTPRTISVDPFLTSLASIQIFSLVIFFAVMLMYVRSTDRLRRVAAFLTVFGFVFAFFAVLQAILSPDAILGIYKPQARPFGTFVNRNDYAAMMVMLASVPMGMLFSGAVPRDRRLLYIVAVGMMGVTILLSQSRGGLLAFVVEILVLVILTTRARGKKKAAVKLGLAMLLLVAAVGGAVFVGGETSLTRLSDTDLAQESTVKTTSRFHMWSVSVRMIGANLPFGVGLGAFPDVYANYDTGSGIERVEQAHNDYLQLVSDAGIVGALMGIMFLFLLIRQARSSLGTHDIVNRGIAAGAFAGVVAVLVHSFFDFVLHITALSLMFLMLLAVLSASAQGEADEVRKRGGQASKPRLRKKSDLIPHRTSP